MTNYVELQKKKKKKSQFLSVTDSGLLLSHHTVCKLETGILSRLDAKNLMLYTLKKKKRYQQLQDLWNNVLQIQAIAPFLTLKAVWSTQVADSSTKATICYIRSSHISLKKSPESIWRHILILFFPAFFVSINFYISSLQN